MILTMAEDGKVLLAGEPIRDWLASHQIQPVRLAFYLTPEEMAANVHLIEVGRDCNGKRCGMCLLTMMAMAAFSKGGRDEAAFMVEFNQILEEDKDFDAWICKLLGLTDEQMTALLNGWDDGIIRETNLEPRYLTEMSRLGRAAWESAVGADWLPEGWVQGS